MEHGNSKGVFSSNGYQGNQGHPPVYCDVRGFLGLELRKVRLVLCSVGI